MARYLISCDEGAMTAPEEDLSEVDGTAHSVIGEAMDAGMWMFGGGLYHDEALSVVATDGTVTDGPYPENTPYVGGMAVIDVPSREEALKWAVKLAVACRCPQDVREFLPDPAVGN